MEKNLKKLGGLHKSQTIMLNLINRGLSKQKAYSIVQSCAMKSWNTEKKFEDILSSHREVIKYINKDEINTILFKSDKIDNLKWIFKNKFK
jgi:adenylosuccinate lyase